MSQNRLYINQGDGRFDLSTSGLPDKFISASSVSSVDFDLDGDIDFFIGGRVIPGRYPEAPDSYVLRNNGSGSFTAESDLLPDGGKLGMVTDSQWVDINDDGWPDLLIVGDLMPITILINENGNELKNRTENYLDNSPSGMWTKLVSGDFDNDGDLDFVVGNFGQNSQVNASDDQPLTLVYDDFDNNGSIDPIFSYYIQGEPYPFASRGELLHQLISLRQKFTSYEIYSEAQLEEILTAEQIEKAKKLIANELSTIYLENKGYKFKVRTMPLEAQFSPIFALETGDFNGDGNLDVILAGNQSLIRIRLGLIDANYGSVFLGDGKGNFSYLKQSESGLVVTGDVRSIKLFELDEERYLLFGINNSPAQVYRLNKP
jgi:hypothetical protein